MRLFKSFSGDEKGAIAVIFALARARIPRRRPSLGAVWINLLIKIEFRRAIPLL
jgi:hypothetical protein